MGFQAVRSQRYDTLLCNMTTLCSNIAVVKSYRPPAVSRFSTVKRTTLVKALPGLRVHQLGMTVLWRRHRRECIYSAFLPVLSRHSLIRMKAMQTSKAVPQIRQVAIPWRAQRLWQNKAATDEGI